MPAIITVNQLESLQLDLSDLSHQQPENEQTVQLIVVPAARTDAPSPKGRIVNVPVAPTDDLQLATWEDAEWR